jgi:hypothetical protein
MERWLEAAPSSDAPGWSRPQRDAEARIARSAKKRSDGGARIKGGPSQYPERPAALAFFRVPRIKKGFSTSASSGASSSPGASFGQMGNSTQPSWARRSSSSTWRRLPWTARPWVSTVSASSTRCARRSSRRRGVCRSAPFERIGIDLPAFAIEDARQLLTKSFRLPRGSRCYRAHALPPQRARDGRFQ